MALQIVSGSEVETPASAVHINAQPFREAALMKGRVGAAVGDSVSGFFGEVSKKFQDNVNARTVLDADLKMRKFSDDFRDSLAKNPDENTWLPDLNEKSTQLREDILSGPHVGPDVKQHLTAMIDQWQQAQSSEVKTAAQIRSINRTKATVIEDYMKAARDGDEQGALAAIDLGVQNHALFPEDADRMRKELPAITQTAQIENATMVNPKHAYDDLKSGKWPALDPKKRATELARVEARMHDWQAQNLDSLRSDYDASGQLNESLLATKVESGEITARGADTLKRFASGETLKDSKANYDLLNGEILTTDVSTMKPQDRAAWKAQLTEDASGLAQVHKNAITRALDAKLKSVDAKDEKTENKVKSQTIAQMHRDFSEGYALPGEKITVEGEPIDHTGWFGSNWFRKKKTEDKIVPADVNTRRGWMNNADLDTLNSTKVRFAQELGKMDDFFKQHAKDNDGQGPTYDEAEQFRQKLMKPYLMDSVSKALTEPSQSTSSQFKMGERRKQGGKVYEWNGSEMVEVK